MSVVEVRVPDMGDSKGVSVLEVLVAKGAAIRVDDPLITLETDKASMDVPSPLAGVIESIAVKKGDTVAAGTLIATVEVEEAAQPAASKAAPGTAGAGSPGGDAAGSAVSENAVSEKAASEKAVSEKAASEKAASAVPVQRPPFRRERSTWWSWARVPAAIPRRFAPPISA